VFDFPLIPFLTEDFSPKGKGIDYLGMRNVNLIFLESKLISGINNATRDIGTYILGTWMTWKFTCLCEKTEGSGYTRDHFRAFSQPIEIAISYATRDGSPVNDRYPLPRNRIGKNQKVDLPTTLTFESIGRGLAASIFYAAQYGPSLKWLRLTADASTEDGKSAGFPMALEDEDTKVICQYVDAKIRQCPHYQKLLKGDAALFTEEEIDELGRAGLCAGAYRRPKGSFKKALEAKLFPKGSTRKLSADLIVATLKFHGPTQEETLRRIWYTGLTRSLDILHFESVELLEHSQQWQLFYSRQLLRYALESLLCCLERAIANGCRSVDESVEVFLSEWKSISGKNSIETFADLLHLLCRNGGLSDCKEPAAAWCREIGPVHDYFEFNEFEEGAESFINAMTMLSGWWMRIAGNETLIENLTKLPDESGRIPMAQIHGWIAERINEEFPDVCIDLIKDFVYSQHLRIGMSRLGEDGTRLRFSLGDHGISPAAKLENFALAKPPFMADRLHALIDLMEDLEYVERNGELIIAR